MSKASISPLQTQDIINKIQVRFEKNPRRHPDIKWSSVLSRLTAHPQKLQSLFEMENSGGEPDVVDFDKQSGEYTFFDCSVQSPSGRRSICYDQEGEKARLKQGIHPKGNALGMAVSMGVEILTEEQYRQLQKLGNFDTTTSSWIQTPSDIRNMNGALFADYRFGHVFIYHNTAPCFYGSRGFRGCLKI